METLLRELTDINAVSSLRCDYLKTLTLLRALKAGTVSLGNVTMTGDGWTVAEVEPPVEPAEASTEPPDEDE